MSSLGVIVGLVCVLSVTVSLVSTLVPQGATSKILSIVTGVFIICVMIIPIKNFATSFDAKTDLPEIPETIGSDAAADYNKLVLSDTRSRLENTLRTKLDEAGYSVHSLEIVLKTDSGGGIYIDSIRINIDKAETRRKEIIALTQKEFQTTPVLVSR